MENIIALKSECGVEFQNLPFENSRKNMKLKIFLNANKNIEYGLEDNKLFIHFINNDDIFNTQQLAKIILFIEHLFSVEILLDSKLSLKIEENENSRNNFKTNFEKLSNLKQNGITNDIEFLEYKNFCDKTLKCTLRDYQYSASYFLTICGGGFDFSVPGSGKTIISYAAYNFLRSKGICDSILIIGPINSYNAWNDEYETCFGEKPDFMTLTNLSMHDAQNYLNSTSVNNKEITFINIDKAWRIKNDIIKFLSKRKSLLIIDEAHKEKNPFAEITKAVLEITKHVEYRIILTGTPMPNGYEDLFSLIKIYSPYEKILSYNYEELKRITKNGASASQELTIKKSITPLYSRVSKKYLLDKGELLPPIFTYVPCKLSKEQKEVYDFLNKFSFELDNDYESALNIALMKAVVIRKMQISSNPGLLSKSIVNTVEEFYSDYVNEYYNDNSEIDLFNKVDNDLKRMIASSDIANTIIKFQNSELVTPKNQSAIDLALNIVSKGEKVLVWDVFVDNMFSLKSKLDKELPGKVEIINGLVKGEERQKAIERFKYGNSMVLIANPSTLAESISLHKACQNAIYVSRNFNAAQYIQSKDRIHRINMPQNTTAHYYILYNKDTIDEAVQEKLELKEQRMLKILDSSDLIIGGSDFENNQFMSLDDVISSFKK